VLSGRGLCDELITRPGESYQLWCITVCDLENLKNEEAMTGVGSQRHKKIYIYIYTHTSTASFCNKILSWLCLLESDNVSTVCRLRRVIV